MQDSAKRSFEAGFHACVNGTGNAQASQPGFFRILGENDLDIVGGADVQ